MPEARLHEYVNEALMSRRLARAASMVHMRAAIEGPQGAPERLVMASVRRLQKGGPPADSLCD